MFMDWKAHIFKIAIIPKLTYRFKTVLIKIPAGFFFGRNWQADPKIYIENAKDPEQPKQLRGKKVGGCVPPHFTT